MFTVFIAKKEHIDAIQQENKLFFEPFLESKELALCEWYPEGQNLSDSVPRLQDAVGRRKQWRAVLIQPTEGELLKARNPFDVVDTSSIVMPDVPPERPTQSLPWEDWEEQWTEYFRLLTERKEQIYRNALIHPLQKLSTWLCFAPEDYILNDIKEKQNLNDWVMERIRDDMAKPGERMEQMEREQYRRELRLVEPSRLVTTAQIGLNLLVKCCGEERDITYCSVDRNCDGLVDALSHILMSNITEVSATEYPPGISSYMYWTADHDYLQHRILPGVSRFLGIGTELSMTALKHQVKKTVWYGGDAYPVLDAHWIARQYYYDLLNYARLPGNQETFDRCFQASFNMCDERVSDYSFITVEDDRNNLFETRRNFATIAREQGFVNVVSSEYMLREYMSENTELFTADAKAIPFITADYARTKRNTILSMCLLLCVDTVRVDTMKRQLQLLNLDSADPLSVMWKEICLIFGDRTGRDEDDMTLVVHDCDGRTVCFEKDKTILFRREYCVESGTFESIYTIEDPIFSRMILDDLQNASYIAEQESKDIYIGTELKGHVYQKYLPGQFFTLSGKYYEMIAATADNRILLRRASEHIGGRLSYRQIRNYTISRLEDSDSMGALKTVNNIDIHYQFADVSVETPGYWKLLAHNDFGSGDMVALNGVPNREYHHKQILKFDFSRFGDSFTDTVRMTLTNLLNEVFVTLFAENQPFICAITPGSFEAPLTYSLSMADEVGAHDKCIFIVEDSQLDIGLLVAVERNVKRIFQIITDYLAWNDEMIEESKHPKEQPKEEVAAPIETAEEKPEKQGFFRRIGQGIKKVFQKIGGWFKKVFGRKKKGDQTEEPSDETETPTDPEETPTDPEETPEKIEATPQPDAEEATPATQETALTPKEQKKAEKEAAKAAKRAEKAQRKAERQAEKAEKKAAKQKAKEEKAAEKKARKEAKAKGTAQEEVEVSEDE